MPESWKTMLQASNITQEEMASNPQAVIEVLGFYAGNLVNAGKDEESDIKMDDMKKSLPLLPESANSSPAPVKKANAGSAKSLPTAEKETTEPKKDGRRLSTLNDTQLMETLRSIVSKQDPTQLYTKIKNIGQG